MAVGSKAVIGRPVRSRQVYSKPRLRVYGTIEAITRNNKNASSSGDNPTKRNNMTGG
jgi:hypothetical protein